MADLTVEEALKELREGFGVESWIRIEQSVFDEPAMSKQLIRRVTISIDTLSGDFEAPTLDEAMAHVRAWKESQK